MGAECSVVTAAVHGVQISTRKRRRRAHRKLQFPSVRAPGRRSLPPSHPRCGWRPDFTHVRQAFRPLLAPFSGMTRRSSDAALVADVGSAPSSGSAVAARWSALCCDNAWPRAPVLAWRWKSARSNGHAQHPAPRNISVQLGRRPRLPLRPATDVREATVATSRRSGTDGGCQLSESHAARKFVSALPP